ncbi:MAG: acyl carrier protein [Candidatus Eremiobacteraeota bacterium]|nr:acyl carrier protein [Candidatus Eremiobacteraeota bacterium]MCW5868331.1 acyl carrier protein [Candidatus Eremiobacteraeota bacterium]
MQKILDFFQARLALRGDSAQLGADESLFNSGRLDSLDAMELIVWLEQEFGVDFSRVDFSLDLIDTPRNVLALTM